MRKLWLIGCSVLLLSSLLLAKDKLVSQWNCGQPSDAHSIDVGDEANHSYAVTKTTCTATKSEVGGVKEKEGIGTQFNETMGDTTTWHGVFVVTAENGDKIHYTYGQRRQGHGEGRTISIREQQVVHGRRNWEVRKRERRGWLPGQGECRRDRHVGL